MDDLNRVLISFCTSQVNAVGGGGGGGGEGGAQSAS